ncbi:hypothetical protein CYR23_15870 [Chimaeribacter arupi]|nr:hypothetical protein CYR23_15870 [Chimaeribacter arupi]
MMLLWSAIMSENYYTQTPNFVSSVSSDVDPRTRLFSFSLSLGTITGNNGMGPDFPVSINYSPTSSSNYWNMGIGTSLGLSMYNRQTGDLYLESGEMFKVNDSGSQPVILHQKIRTVVFTRINDETYRVIEQDGSLTELQDVAGDGLFRPVQRCSPLGYALTLHWAFDAIGFVLASVSDDSGDTLCTFEYDGYGETTVHFYPGCTEAYYVTLSTLNNYLTDIRHTGVTGMEEDYYWQLDYDDVGMGNGLLTLIRVTTPTGLIKEAIYNYGAATGIMRFPDEAGLPPLPAVTQLTISPGQGQPEMVTLYSATEDNNDSNVAFRNYLGYAFTLGSGWDPDSDNMYAMLDPAYLYQTIVTQVSSEGAISDIKNVYTYNNYHLLQKTDITQNATRHLTEMDYYAQAYQEFDDQPAQCLFPRQQTVTWTDALGRSRSEITTFEYDEHGNLRQQTGPDGTVISYVYYPPEGEAATDADYYDISQANYSLTGCPADPNGFPRWLKYKIQQPPVVNGYTDVPVRAAFYRYDSFTPVGGSPVTQAVLPRQQTNVECTLSGADLRVTVPPILAREIIAYAGDPASLFYGQIQQVEKRYYGDDGRCYRYGRMHDYRIATPEMCSAEDLRPADESYREQVTHTTYDNLSVTTSSRYSRYTHQLWSSVDELGNTHDSYYNALGGVVREVRNADNPDYRVEQRTSYTLSPAVDGIFTATSDSKGNASREYYDGMGRAISVSMNGPDYQQPDTWFEISRTHYDALGRPALGGAWDYYFDDNNALEGSSSVTETTLYDDWGEACQTNSSIGQNQVYSQDPVSLTTLETLAVPTGEVELGWRQTRYNPQGLPVSVTVLHADKSPYSTTASTYDGLNRLRKYQDALGHVTEYTYDKFDRTLTQTVADGTQIQLAYDPASTDEQPIRMQAMYQVNGAPVVTELGTQTFDGLGRRVAVRTGGRENLAAYSGANTMPDWTKDAKQQAIYYGYIPELDNMMRYASDNPQGTAGRYQQNFTYENSTGLLLTAQEQGSRGETHINYPSGALQQQVFDPASGAQRQAGYHWSLQGAQQRSRDIAGNAQVVKMDSYGRPIRVEDAQVVLTFTYDEAGRLSAQVAEAKDGSRMMTLIDWDEFNRETARTIDASTGDTLSITLEYALNHQVSHREIWKNSTLLRAETFTYDNRNRLRTYQCEGSELPVDAYGYPMMSQQFDEIDALNNILRCTTQLPDGEDVALFEYGNPADPTQLTGITHSLTSHYPAHIVLKYDENGRMVQDDAGRTLAYDVAGRLSQTSAENGNALYAYDSFNQLVLQSLNNNSDPRELYYQDSRLTNEVHLQSGECTRFIPGFSGTAAVSNEPL